MKIRKFDSINIVPFIDIVLVLLMIVLVSVSFTHTNHIEVNLSKSSYSDKSTPYKRLTITITQHGEIYFNNQKIDKKGVEVALLNYSKRSDIVINCDKNSKFDYFVTILNLLKKHNFIKINILTDNE